MTVINKWIKGLSSLSCQSHPLEVIILRPWGLVLQLCCTTLTGWFLCPRPLHDLHFNSHAQWRHLVANSRNVYLCVHQDCLNVNFALKFADKFFNWSSDCEDWAACIQEFRAFQNSTGKNITFDRLITVVLRACWSSFFFCIDTVGTSRWWAVLTARTALPRKPSAKMTSPWSRREPTE